MKILFVSTLYAPNNVGGAEATVRLLAEELVARGHEAVVVSLAPDGRRAEAEIAGVRSIYLPLANVYFPHRPHRRGWLKPLWHLLDAYNPVMARRLGQVLDVERPDVVNVHNAQGFSVAAWNAVARRGIPIVQTLHDYYTGCANSSMFRHGHVCARPCTGCRVLGVARRHLSNRPAVVTTVSRRTFDLIRQAGVYRTVSDVRVIQNCILDGHRRADGPHPTAGSPLRLGFIGRLEPLKGLDMMLDAVGHFESRQVQVLVGGRGDAAYEDALRRRYAGPQVEFRGWVDPNAFFAEIDMLVVPSLWEEPLPRVCHEAMAHGVPIIASRLGGLPEIVREHETGFLFRGGDTADLVHVLRRILQAPPDWDALSANSRRHAEGFRMERIFDRYWSAWMAAAGTAAGDEIPIPVTAPTTARTVVR